jgi:hypothetical protein
MLSGKLRITKPIRFSRKFQSTVLLVLITLLIAIASIKARTEGSLLNQNNSTLINNK